MLCFKNRTSLEDRVMKEQFRYLINGLSYNPFTVSNGNTLEFTWGETVKQAQGACSWIYDSPLQYAPYKVGDRIAQMVVLPYPNVHINVVDELSTTDRGEGGFGSTGN
jgi:hypothetical protein